MWQNEHDSSQTVLRLSFLWATMLYTTVAKIIEIFLEITCYVLIPLLNNFQNILRPISVKKITKEMGHSISNKYCGVETKHLVVQG